MNENYFIIYFDDDSEIKVNIDKDFLKKYAVSYFANSFDEVNEILYNYFYDKFLNYFDGYTLDSIEEALNEKPLSYRWNIRSIDWSYDGDEGTIGEEVIDGEWQDDFLQDLSLVRGIKDVDESEHEEYPSNEIKKFPR